MKTLTQFRCCIHQSGQMWPIIGLLQLLLLLAGPALGGSLDAILNPDGTVRAGACGSFNVKGYRLKMTSDGRPMFWEKATESTTYLAPAATLADGMDDEVYALAVDASGNMYAGGRFSTAGGVIANHIAKWNGSSWSALGTGINGFVYALAVDGSGNVYAGGNFTTAGGVTASKIAKWNGTTWSALGTGMDVTYGVAELAVDGSGSVYAGGSFNMAGGVTANSTAKWNGSSWSALGTTTNGYAGTNGYVNALAIDGNGNVYVGGLFTTAGGVATNYIAKWDGSSWSALGTGMNYIVSALLVDGGTLYAGGPFTTAGGVAANYIAKWNGSSWSALGTGMNNYVLALMADGNGALYAGGDFTTAGGVATNYVAKWNGSSWSALGTGMNSSAYALAANGSGTLYVGGQFTTAGGITAHRIAKWNGSSWSALQEVPALTAYHLTQPGNTTQLTDLHYQVTNVVKVGADNTAATLFRVANGGSNLTLRLRENPTNSTAVPLADAVGYLGSLVTTSTTTEVIYTHPAYVNSVGSHSDLHLEVIDNTVPTAPVLKGTYLIQAVRPPLLLVHGLWSTGMDAFPGLRAKLIADGLYDNERQIRYADYDGAAAFAANAWAIINHKRGHLQTYADLNISASKVDVIGHSMGGLLTRQYVQSAAYQHDVNKLITLNTPHSGSPIPNFINGLPPTEKLALVIGLAFVGKDAVSGAVDDLSYNGPAITSLNAAPSTRGAAAHAVTTNITLNPLLPVQQLINGQFSWGGLLAGWMALKYPHASQNINNYLTNEVYRNPNDLVVGLNSQQGGLVGPYTDNTAGQWHGSGGNPAVQTQFETLLRANSHSTAATNPFTTTGFQPVQISSVFLRLAAPPVAKITSTLLITAPTRNVVITDKDSIQVAVSASSDVTRIMLVCGTGTAEITTKLITGAGGTAYIKIPKHGLGRLKLAAFAFADSTYVQYDTLGTRLTTNATVQGIRLEPRLLYTSPGDSAMVQVMGTYSDGIDRNVLGQPGMLFSFPGGGKARMGKHNGYVVGLTPGRDSLRVTYAGRTDVVPLIVSSALATPLATRTPTASQLTVWPNPAQQQVQISGVADVSIELLDLLGRTVRTHAAIKLGAVATLDLRGLSPGLYIVKAGTATRRLLVE